MKLDSPGVSIRLILRPECSNDATLAPIDIPRILLVRFAVRNGASVLDAAEAVDDAGLEQDRLVQVSLPGAAVADQATRSGSDPAVDAPHPKYMR